MSLSYHGVKISDEYAESFDFILFFLPWHVCRSLALLRVKAIKLCVPVERTALELVFGVCCKKIPFVIFIRWRGTQLKVCVGKAPGSQSFNGFETTRSAW